MTARFRTHLLLLALLAQGDTSTQPLARLLACLLVGGSMSDVATAMMNDAAIGYCGLPCDTRIAQRPSLPVGMHARSGCTHDGGRPCGSRGTGWPYRVLPAFRDQVAALAVGHDGGAAVQRPCHDGSPTLANPAALWARYKNQRAKAGQKEQLPAGESAALAAKKVSVCGIVNCRVGLGKAVLLWCTDLWHVCV